MLHGGCVLGGLTHPLFPILQKREKHEKQQKRN